MKFALAGNPNCGKTTLFNTLTGSTAHVGNWPGVTVDLREGVYRHEGKDGVEEITIVDLPGVYSLSPRTPEELLARDYIILEKPDLIINIVDVTNLERNLYLTTQLLETDTPLILALNMIDALRKSNDSIDMDLLSNALDAPVAAISALQLEGVAELMTRAYETAANKRIGVSVLARTNMRPYLQQTECALREHGITDSLAFHAGKLLEGDAASLLRVSREHPELSDTLDDIRNDMRRREGMEGSPEDAVAELRYRYIARHCLPALISAETFGAQSRSERIDRVLTHKIFGLPLFALFMLFVFNFTFGSNFLFFTGLPSPGVWLLHATQWLAAAATDRAAAWLMAWGASPWLYGLFIDGLFSGLAAVLSFLPQIMLLFLFLAIMEDSGYMPRAAFMMDRVLRLFGLSGKAFMPMLMGFGCSVPAIMATRTLESEKDRRLTIMLITGFSCGAKLPIWLLFAAALFPKNTDLMVFGVYFLGIASAAVSGLILNKTLFRRETESFVMELPPYRMPKLSNMAADLWDKLKSYLSRAATLIAAAVIVIWALSNYNFSLQAVSPSSPESALGVIGGILTPVFAPLGFAAGPDGWKSVVAILTGLLSKETVVATLGVLSGSGSLFSFITAAFTPAAALSFMAFNLLTLPCLAAVATARMELKSWKWMCVTIGFWLALSYLVSLLCYWGGTLLGY